MSAKRTPAEMLASIPGWSARPAIISPLPGGLNNDAYRIDSNGYRYALRIADTTFTTGAIDRDAEYRIQQKAAARGLAAPIIHANAESGLMLAEFLPGKVLNGQILKKRSNLESLGWLLRELHELPLCGVNFDGREAADSYMKSLQEKNVASDFALRCVEIIASTPPPAERRCCHNDVIASNLIKGDALRLIDFEYARDNDPLFDLASVLCWHNFGERELDWLLGAYAGAVTGELRERLALQCRHYDALQWLWMAVRQTERAEEWAAQHMVCVEERLN